MIRLRRTGSKETILSLELRWAGGTPRFLRTPPDVPRSQRHILVFLFDDYSVPQSHSYGLIDVTSVVQLLLIMDASYVHQLER